MVKKEVKPTKYESNKFCWTGKTVPMPNRTIYDWGYDATIDVLGK